MRRRHRLQVDTFPFLAVLLCAMGALILILLIMDRRSRLAAAARARATSVRNAPRATPEPDRVVGEDDPRLEAERKALDDEMRQVQARLAEVARDLQKEEAGVGNLRRTVQEKRSALNGHERAYQDAQKEAADLKTTLAMEDRARQSLAAELVQLEEVIRDLKATRRRDAQTYSVIPYKGKYGEQRRPLYVECTRLGHLFHPDRFELIDPSLEALRLEILRRVTRIAENRQRAGLKEERPYLMMLIRPEGIVRYYQVQSAIRELPVEFGYEFVDADWVLSVPPEASELAGVAEPSLSKPPPDEPIRKDRGVDNFPRVRVAGVEDPGRLPQAPGTGDASGALRGLRPQPHPPSEAGSYYSPDPKPSPVTGTSTGSAGRSRLRGTGGNAGVGGTGADEVPDGSGPGGVTGGLFGNTSSGAEGGGGPVGRAGRPPSNLALLGLGGTGVNGGDGRPGGSAGGMTGRPGRATEGLGQRSTGSPSGDGVPNRSSPGLFGMRAVPGGGTQGASSSPIPLPDDGSGRIGKANPDGPTKPIFENTMPPAASDAIAKASSAIQVPSILPNSPAANTGGAGGTSAGSWNTSPGGSGGASDGRAVQGNRRPQRPVFRGPESLAPPPRNRPLLPARIGAAEETTVFIECRSTGVVVHPLGQSIPFAALAESPANNTLHRTVVDQLALHKGNPARRQVRFLIHRDAERTFHAAYPVLDDVKVDKTRYTLQPGDDVSRLILVD